MATLVLTALGTAIGGPLGGAIGGLIGSSLDQAVLFKPKGREGRRLTESVRHDACRRIGDLGDRP